jgi:hypothetical protein
MRAFSHRKTGLEFERADTKDFVTMWTGAIGLLFVHHVVELKLHDFGPPFSIHYIQYLYE